MPFTCPRCGTFTANPNDEREKYCAVCHDFVGDEPTRMGLLPHLTVFELREQLRGVQQLRAEVEALQMGPAYDELRARLVERVAVLRSLETANAEAIYGAMAQAPTDTLRLIGDLRRRLAAMEYRDSGGKHYTAADVHGRALEAIEATVVNHLRARSPQLDLDLRPPGLADTQGHGQPAAELIWDIPRAE